MLVFLLFQINANRKNKEKTDLLEPEFDDVNLDSPVFIVDRPFIYVLRDNPTNTILLTGGITDPTNTLLD